MAKSLLQSKLLHISSYEVHSFRSDTIRFSQNNLKGNFKSIQCFSKDPIRFGNAMSSIDKKEDFGQPVERKIFFYAILPFFDNLLRRFGKPKSRQLIIQKKKEKNRSSFENDKKQHFKPLHQQQRDRGSPWHRVPI